MNLLSNKRGRVAAMMLRCARAHLLPAGAAAIASALAESAAVAQGTGVLTGQAVDAQSRKPLADAVVSVTSPGLQGAQTVLTDSSGVYRIPNLPPGDYTLRLDLDAYHPYRRGGIAMRSSSTIQVNVELLPEKVVLEAKEVIVTAKAPTVDVSSTSTGVSMNQDFISRLPLSSGAATRSFESLAVVTPGAQTDMYGVSINGTTSPENSFVIDGVSVNSPAFGTLGTPLSIEFIKEVSIISGGYMPEHGRAIGGIFDVTTKSGSNELHGSVFFNITPGEIEGRRAPVRRDGTTITTSPSLGSLRDFGAEVGGPIVKDRLWFYAGVQAAFTRNVLTRKLSELTLGPDGEPIVDASTGFTRRTDIPGAVKTYYADQRTIQYIGKLTYVIDRDQNVTLSTFGTPTTSGGNGTISGLRSNITGPYSAYAKHSVEAANDVSLRYVGALNNKRQILDLTIGWHHQRSATLPNDGSPLGGERGTAGEVGFSYRRTTSPDPTTTPDRHSITEFESVPAGYCKDRTVMTGDPMDPIKVVNPCPVTSYAKGGPGFLDDSSLNSYQGKIVGTSLVRLAGHHVIKAGAELQLASFKHEKATSGGVSYRENSSGTRPSWGDSGQYGFLVAPDTPLTLPKSTAESTSLTVGGFVQDSWQVMDKVTLNVGLRYDAQFIYGTDGAVGLSLPNQWSPRVGVIYDFTQKGRSKIFASYARYYEAVPLDISDVAFPGTVQVSARHKAKSPTNPDGCDPAVDPRSDGCRGSDQIIVGDPRNGNTTFNPNQGYQRLGGDKVPVDPDLMPQSSDELVIGGEYEVFPDARLGVSYTKRYLNHVIEDLSHDEANSYSVANPGYGTARDFPKAKRDYDAVSFYFQKGFAGGWLAQASYTISSLRGNYGGLFRAETGQLDPNLNADFDLRSLLVNRDGPLPGDKTHQIKLYAAKDFFLPGNMDVLVGLTFRTASGAPQSYLGAHPLYGENEVYILPRGAAGRGDWIHTFDARVGYSIKLGKMSSVGLLVDVFNLFNFQGAVTRDPTYTTVEVNPIVNGTNADLPTQTGSGKLLRTDGSPFDPRTDIHPNFNKPTSYQDPRQIRFGAKVTF